MSELDQDIVQKVSEAKRALSTSDYIRKFERINLFAPSPKQWAMINIKEKFGYGKSGNQFGKTSALGAFVTYNVLGRYPKGYTGWKPPKLNLQRPNSFVVWWLSATAQMTREGGQTALLGDVAGGRAGTGLIPADRIVSIANSRGIAGAVDSATILRDDGTHAVIRFKSYEQGREALQAEAVDLIVCDEMLVDPSMWSELIARTTATGGVIRLAATPLRQQSPIALWFREPGHPDRVTVNASLDDATHLTDEQRAAIKASYTEQELQTRYFGHDWTGGGAIYRTPVSEIAEIMDPNTFGPHISYGISIDISHAGSTGYFAALFCAYDPLSNVLRIFDGFKMKGAIPEQHVARIMQSPIYDAPVIWPHDANQGTVIGENFAQIYKRLGLRMTHKHAEFEGGGYSVEAGIALVDQWLATGRIKVSKHLHDFFEEYQTYERDDAGKIIKTNDHMLDAMRYAVMSVKKFRVLDGDTRQPPTGLQRKWSARDFAMHGRRQKNDGICKGVNFDVFDPSQDE